MAKQQKSPNLITPKSTKEGSLATRAKELAKERIEAGEYFDPEYIKEHGIGAPADYQGIDTYYGQLEKGAFDKYSDYIGEDLLKGGQYTFEELNKLRAENQSNWEQAGHAVGRVVTNIIPQTLSGFASMLDIKGYWDAEHAANNGIVNWAMDAKKTVDEDWFPIYEENPGQSMQLGDFAWWMSRGSGLVESVGSFLLQGAGMGKLVSTGLKGIGTLTRGKQLLKAVGIGAEGSKKLYEGSAGLLNAVALNQSEAVLEATQVFRDTYEDQLAKNGGDFAKAKQAASIAAATTMQINRANILLNLSSASAFITPLKYTRKLLDAPSTAKTLGKLAFEGGQEAAEELVNHVGSKAGMAKGKGEKYTLEDAFNDMGSMEGFEAAFLGAIGGVGQKGGTNLFNRTKFSGERDENGNRISVYETEKNRYEQQQKVIQELKEKGVNTTDVLKSYKDQLVFQDKLQKAHEKAKTTGDYSEVETLKNEMFENQAIKAFQSGTTEILEDLYKAEAARPVDEVGQEYIDNANNAIKQLKQLESIYNNFEGYSNVDEIFFNRANKNRIERRAKDIEAAKKSADLELHQQVSEIAKKYEYTNEQPILFKKNGELEKTEMRTTTSPLTYSLADLQNNTGTTESNQKVYEQFLSEVEKLPAFQKADQYNQQASALNKTLIENEKEFQTITSEEYQEKAAARKAEAVKLEQLKKDLEKATTKSQVENLKNSTKDPAFRKAADDKLADIELKNVKEAKVKQIKATIDGLNTKINAATLDNIEDVRKEVDDAELSQKDKQSLYDNLNKQARRLNGESVPEEESGLSAFGFTATNPEEDASGTIDNKKTEEELKAEQANFETNIPSDYVNPSTEKKSVEEGVAEAAGSLLDSDRTMVVGEDEEGNLVYNYSRSQEGHNRAAFLSREMNQTEEIGSVNREEITNDVDNIKLLDPDFMTPGTELVMEIDTEYSGDKYDPSSNTRETIAWNLRLEQLQKMADEKGVPLNELDEYIDEVPIKVTTKDGETVFYVHDNAWYREENLDNTIEAIGLDKAKNHEIRKEIIKSGKVKSKVTYKSMGRLFKTYDNKSIPVSEAMPDGNLILAIGRSDSFEVDLNGATLLPSTPQNGRLYAIVPVGKDTYLPIPLERQPLTEEAIDSIVFAIEGYLSQDRDNPVAKAIRESSLGLDITELSQLGKYINQFVGLFYTKGTQGLEPFLINGGKNSSLKSAHPLIAVTATGIEFGKPGIENGSYIHNGKKVVRYTATISANFKDKTANYRNKETLEKKLRPMLKAMMSNADRKTLAMDGDAVIILNSEGETSTKKYTEFVKETHKTNILSVNTGTEENPKWAYTIQPTILFDTSFADLSKIKPVAVKKAVPKAAPKVTPVTSTTTVSSNKKLSEKQAEVENIRAELNVKYEELKAKGLPNTAEIWDNPEYVAIKNRLNAAEAELAALEGTTTTNQTEIENKKAEIKKLEKENVKDAVDSNEVSIDQVLPDLQKNGFESLEDAIASLQKAVELFNSRAENKDSFVLPDGTTIELDDNTPDASDIDDDTVDEMISPMDSSQIESIRTEVEDMIIRGLDPSTQASLISYIASDIISRAMAAKDKGQEGVKTAPIFAEHKKSFEALEKLYKERNLVNKAARMRAVLDQFDKVNKLVNQKIRLLTTGTVQEDINLDDNEEAMGLEKVVYTDDWAFTVNSKSTASADLKKFFVGIRAVDENGKPVSNILGLPEIMTFDTVYNTLHELLANRPADYNHMIETLGLYQEKFPWIQAVVDKLEKAPKKIQNEFVSDMAKHHIDMKFLMWSKDRNGNYSLQRWSSNSSSIEQRLRAVWQSNLKGVGTQSNLVILNEDNEYVYNQDLVDNLIEQAQVFKQDPTKVTNDDLANWLGQFGIVISDDTYRDLRKGEFKNRGKKSWAQLFTNDAGLVFALAKELKAQRFMLLDDAKILNDSVVKALAKLDALNNMNTFSNSFQAGGKTVYSYGNNNYLVNRMRDLTAYDHSTKKFVNQKLIDDLKQISFTKDSLWLADLTNEGITGDLARNTLDIGYLSLEALKKLFTESRDNRKLNNLSTAEHELTKIGFFQRVSGEIIKDPKTGIPEQRRSVDFFYPTMSDKTTMLLISGLTRQLKLNAEGNISDENIKLLYKALVTPEINRIRAKQSTNIKGYEPNYFYFLPSLNTLEIEVNGETKTFLDIVKDGNDTLFDDQVEQAVLNEIRFVFDNLITKKLEDWKKLGIGQEIRDDKGKVIEKYSFMDKAYMSEVAKEGKGTNRVKYAAMDYVFNYLIANSEAFKLFAGDPALYAKFNKDNTLQENLEETFVNIGKRLAGDIAPGIELANSTNNKYYQVFFQDKKIDSNNVKDSVQREFFEKVISTYADTKKGYGAIEGSDAQEYTTWQEHLYVMKQLGRITDAQYNTFKTKLEAQSRGIFKASTILTYDEMGIVMQPIKPVYVGNIISSEDNADRRVYIKSSSFPLLPQLTQGLQIDKIRQSLEKFEETEGKKITSDGTPAFVRASFGTANKVGAISKAVEVFDNQGNVLDNIEVKLENSLLLSRENFRIQQDVPYKRDKADINIGTQERTLLFADLLDVKIDGEITGAELMELYNKQYEELFAYASEKLSKKLGLIQTVTTESSIESLLTIPDSEIFDKVEEFSEKLKAASPIQKVKLQQDFADEVGEDTLERVNFINKNFDKIVEQLAKAKMNFFFDEETDTNKKCD